MTRRQTVKQSRVVRPRGAPGVQIGELAARAMVLQGAGRVFAKMGVRAVSVETLLAASGISRRTFYRLYQSKEDVMIALYRLGTDELLEACRLAIEQERDPLRQLERCIDAHLKNARDRGRLVFVLGGEAQRQESALHARRMQVHDELVDMLAASAARHFPGGVDPLLVRALVLALESVTRIVLAEGNEGRRVSDAALARARSVMLRISTAALVGQGAGVTALPRH
jgi:AcrR family transcriptional regulator